MRSAGAGDGQQISPRVSCGVVMLNAKDELLMCHATGTRRWDLPKGMGEPGETALETALRETREETGLRLPAERLVDLGERSYRPGKRLHLFALRVERQAFALAACRCRSKFVDAVTGAPTPEMDAYAWLPVSEVSRWCGPNLTRVLAELDWGRLRELAPVQELEIEDLPEVLEVGS